MWQGTETITDYKTASAPCADNTDFLNGLNNYSGQLETFNDTTVRKADPHHHYQVLSFDPADVRRTLRRVNSRKAADPDNIPGCVRTNWHMSSQTFFSTSLS